MTSEFTSRNFSKVKLASSERIALQIDNVFVEIIIDATIKTRKVISVRQRRTIFREIILPDFAVIND